MKKSNRKQKKLALRSKKSGRKGLPIAGGGGGLPATTAEVVLPIKAKSGKGRRVLASREPQLQEGPKRTLIMKGTKASQQMQNLLKDINATQKPNSVFLSSRNQQDFLPFEDFSSGEYLCQKNDSSLFCLGSCSKKRPFRLVAGRLFNRSLLDMYEFSVGGYRPCQEFPAASGYPAVGSKPLLLVQGAAFEQSDLMKNVKNFLCDLFKGPNVSKLCLNGIDRAIVLTALPPPPPKQEDATTTSSSGVEDSSLSALFVLPVITFRQYKINLKKSTAAGSVGAAAAGDSTTTATTAGKQAAPQVELEEVGPSFSMRLDRYKLPTADRWKSAMKLPVRGRPHKHKNVSSNPLGETKGRIHVGRQDLKELNTHHYHGAGRKAKKAKKEDSCSTAAESGAEELSEIVS
eukprot:GHVS01006932.1.p1 GENE.GHVS01006932.1~~GHVS01006932.1.p1  ORF type:complete len:403 (-),score=118.20 GHVS01006932.1:575-1783(-)